MNGPLITAIIPTYRRPEVVEAVRSALSQADGGDGPRIEVLVVDDSPEGSARELVESLRDPRVTYRKRPTPSNGRPALVRNDAWPHARGRYVHFLDDDDLVIPGAYRALSEALDRNPGASMSFGRVEPFGEDPEAVRREAAFWEQASGRARRAARLGRLAFVATMLFDGAVLQSSACLVRKTALREVEGFDPILPLQEDTDLYARGTRLGGCVFLDQPVVRYRVTSTSLMRTGDTQTKLEGAYARMHRKYRERHGFAEYFALKLCVRAGSAIARLASRGVIPEKPRS
jgi:glycosyltransferase involved in cell wall biosynthesis